MEFLQLNGSYLCKHNFVALLRPHVYLYHVCFLPHCTVSHVGCDYIHAPHHVPAEPKGVDTLLLGLSRLTRLEHLSLTCYNDSALEREAILHPGGAEIVIHELQLHALTVNFMV